MLITGRNGARLSLPDHSITQLDCIHIRPVMRPLLACRLILREERYSKIARPTSYVARSAAVTS